MNNVPCNLGWPRTYFVAENDLKFLILLCMPPNYYIIDQHHHVWQGSTFSHEKELDYIAVFWDELSWIHYSNSQWQCDTWVKGQNFFLLSCHPRCLATMIRKMCYFIEGSFFFLKKKALQTWWNHSMPLNAVLNCHSVYNIKILFEFYSCWVVFLKKGKCEMVTRIVSLCFRISCNH